ncbi:MAG TPA: HEAT repeat domain-containing protein [Blastocatellia bacterium]|nr:HEAT repeat domain-containing protein [Blastocatellia bacterium]HMV85157.1 HEAT repeat domain-containing protein [Blastocatellia bacterium]HMX29149.1 HEAT repeat domain-containing protein [Blastocatellia bacterium]HMY73023.1 HEAT repeat domain-containing protein [Blastocatellia bacterium]HMZ22858.1 HEAT repeat domain-containing protein [Blastocatellia bacterium]
MKHVILTSLILFGLAQIANPFVTRNAGAAMLSSAAETSIQHPNFLPVQGTSLAGKIETAVRQARASNAQARFWTGWAFDVRPGVAVDYEWTGKDGKIRSGDGFNVSFDRNVETRNLGVFLLHEAGSVARVEVYNLERQRSFDGLPVFWCGKTGNEESLNYLRQLTETQQTKKNSDHGIVAIALHDDARVGGILKQFVRSLPGKDARNSAVFWLGQIGGETAFLSELVASEQENVEVRKQAAFAIGVGKDGNALSTLQSLFQSVTNREVKKQLVFAVSVHGNKDGVQDEAVNYLIQLATNEKDVEVKKQAIFWLGQKAGERSLKALGDTVNSNDADTEVQKQAVFAISQRPKDEAVPLLINIAKTHAKAEVRKQAIFWLGQTGDERAVAFFKELLSQ